MEKHMTNGGGRPLNPFDDDVDSDDPSQLNEENLSLQEMEQFWREINSILCSSTMDPFIMEELREQLSNIEKLLIKDRPESCGQIGVCLRYLLSENIIENIYMFSTRQKVYAKEIRIMLLKFFTEVFTRASQPVLIHQQILRPISKLLRSSEGMNDREMSTSLIPLLHTMCILMQENQSLLDLFFIESQVHNMQSRFLVFTQLIPYIHESSEVGNRARDAILLCLSLADQLTSSSLTHYIASDCNFCQVLATGLSALYSRLPSTRDLIVDDWQSPLPVIEAAVPELKTFIQALDFCNSVLQMAPKLVCNTMLTLVREGFLQQVMGPALLQASLSAVMFSTAYMTIFLTHITNVALMREFLCYITQGRYDDRCVVDSLVQNINSSNHLLSSITLELFFVLLDLNCEDVMLELVLKYLIPGRHVMPNQLAIIGSPDLYAQAARKFLQLLPASCITAENMLLESIKKSISPPSPPHKQEVLRASVSPPPLFTSSPLPNLNHLEQPSPISSKLPLTNLQVIPPPPTASTNPFDDPLPTGPTSSRSRSNSDTSTSSLVSMSSASSSSQPTTNSVLHSGCGPESTRSKLPLNLSVVLSSRSTSSFKFDVVSPEMTYFYNLTAVREAIKDCSNKCRCWSSIYDKCNFSKETILEESKKLKKSLEMEDMTSIKIRVTPEETNSTGASKEDDVDLHRSAFRSRATTTTAATNSKLSRTSNLKKHDQLHSRSRAIVTPAEEEEESKMVAGVSPSTQQPQENSSSSSSSLSSSVNLSPQLRRSGTISGGSRSRPKPGSPRLSSRHELSSCSQFEDKTGLFLKIVIEKLTGMMQHPPTVNILLTRLVCRLVYYPQPLLRSLLLNHQLVLKPGIPNLLSVLQSLKQTVDRYARTEEGFEKRLGRARKTMLYRAQVRTTQVQGTVAQQIIARQLHQQSSRTDLDGSLPVEPPHHHHTPDASRGPSPTNKVSKTILSNSRTVTQDHGGKMQRSTRKKKKVSTDTLFAVVVFYEFLRELASISEEQSIMHSMLYLPKST